MIHKNLCDYAEDSSALYRLWDDDLKKMMHRRQFYESAGLLCFLAASIAWKTGVETFWVLFGVIVGIYLMFSAVKLMIDEGNINYLMHQWDLRNALEHFRRTERQA
jgi:hypothetical protein